MEAERSEGLHFRKSAETTGKQTFIFKRVSEMEAERSEALHFRRSAETTGSIPLKLALKLSEHSEVVVIPRIALYRGIFIKIKIKSYEVRTNIRQYYSFRREKGS